MPKAHINNIDIYYETHGSGDPLILIGGLGYDIWQWHKMVPELAKEFEVIIFDNRGAGKSDCPPGPYSADILAEDTAGLLDYLGLAPAAVMGFSMGGFVAQALVINRPELVSKLILADTTYGGPNYVPMTPDRLAKLADLTMDPVERAEWGIEDSTGPGFKESNQDFVKEWLQYILGRPMTPEGFLAQMAIGLGLDSASYEDSFQPKLKNISVPTLILFGELDVIVPTANAELLAQEIPGSRIEILPNTGHFFPFNNYDLAVSKITSFLME
jgi:pimeloyl-ACP methyl ester carboxylesterase